jgi:hypothetical protein
MSANTDLISSSKSRLASWAGIVTLAFGFFACGRTSTDAKDAAARGSLATRVAVHHQKVFTAWSEPVNMGPTINTSSDDNHPGITRDGLSLYITTNRLGGLGGVDIWVSHRPSINDPWGRPVNVPNINTPFNEGVPNITPDGHTMYFNSNRPGGCGGVDMYMSTRKDPHDDFAWGKPVNLGCAPNGPNTEIDENGPTYLAGDDAEYLFYNVNLIDNPAGTIPGGCGGADILMSVRHREDDEGDAAQPFWPPGSVVKSLCSPRDDTRTSIRSDGLEIIFSSNRAGAVGANDIWVATRPSLRSDWSNPVNLGPTINTTANEGGSALSFDGTTLYFYSTRPGGFGGRDLYTSTRAVIHQGDAKQDKEAEQHNSDEEQ